MTGVRLRRAVGGVGATVALLVGLTGFAHTRAGRPLLMAMGRAFKGGGACPLGYDRAPSAADRLRARQRFAATHRGPDTAAARPALDFDLETTRRTDVVAALSGRGMTCRDAVGLGDMVCDGEVHKTAAAAARAPENTPATAPPPRTLWLSFDDQQRLVGIIATSRDRNAAPISAAFAAVKETVSRQSGPPSRISGEANPVFLAAGTLRQASAEFRFANYYASARATNMGDGYLLTEEYRALPQ